MPSASAPLPSLPWSSLAEQLVGELHTGEMMRAIYATDASAYQETPLAVAIPQTEADLMALIHFARTHGVGLTPRTAGTSLAGQVVGAGIVVDVSRHFTRILEINADKGWVSCQPGVIRNELNMALAPHGLLFGPETSTQNRAMMGGMLGNNSCGSNSIQYGSVRDHVLEVTALLADGSKVVFGPLSAEAFTAKCDGPDTLETRLYRETRRMLADPATRQEIRDAFPHPEIPRRNTGYALDLLMDATALDPQSERPFHFGQLIAGSEGTLCLVTEIKLHCDPLPPGERGLQCAQFVSVEEALRATQLAIQLDAYAVELIDDIILACTERSLEHRENRFFLERSPGAVLVTELRGTTRQDVQQQADALAAAMQAEGLGYAYPVLFGADTTKIWNLRKAGLGLMNNMPGDAKPAPVIEDTAVRVADLPAYIAEFNQLLAAKGLSCVHYAHAGSGEIHLRPILNLKTAEGHRLFREVAQMIANLVKKYRGSLSGEHGDGRLRGEFLQEMIGQANYERVRAMKHLWDPTGIFNPGKIVDTPPMDTSLRVTPGQQTTEPETLFDWSSTRGMLGAAEMCGTMCPSYMATRDEKDTTRARANLLRQALTNGTRGARHALNNPEVKEVLDLCLSCKGCKKECPSTVDMAKLKAEFTQAYQDANGVPLRSRLIANFARSQRLARLVPGAWNALFGRPAIRRVLNLLVGFHPERTIPLLPPQTFGSWFARHQPHPNAGTVGAVWLFNDEFNHFTDVQIGIDAVELLEALGYRVALAPISESGRTWLSKGLVRQAKTIINANLAALDGLITADQPLLGLEPSGILTFRDEAPDLATEANQATAVAIAPHALMLESFLVRAAQAGRVCPDAFTDAARTIKLHGHCFQKALVGAQDSAKALALPRNYAVEQIPSGCCGMAGSFGYEMEHYALSQQIGELVLFPSVRAMDTQTLLAAPGTSCRHQIHDATGRTALHPASILRAALRSRGDMLGVS